MHSRLFILALCTLGLTGCGNFKATDKNLPVRYQNIYQSQQENYALAARAAPVTRQTRTLDGQADSGVIGETSASRISDVQGSYADQGLRPSTVVSQVAVASDLTAIPFAGQAVAPEMESANFDAIALKNLRFDQILLIQASLINEGYAIPELNGELDVKTLQALVAFQSKHNIQADGQMRRNTYEKLGLHWEAV